MPHILDFLADRVLLCDGGMGTQVQARNLRIEEDFHGHENCTEILTESRPDLVREIHRGYLAAGADAQEGIKSFFEKRAPNFSLKPSKDMPPFGPWAQGR